MIKKNRVQRKLQFPVTRSTEGVLTHLTDSVDCVRAFNQYYWLIKLCINDQQKVPDQVPSGQESWLVTVKHWPTTRLVRVQKIYPRP